MSGKGYPSSCGGNDTSADPGLPRGRSSLNLEAQEPDSQPMFPDSMPPDSLEMDPPVSQECPEECPEVAMSQDNLPQSSQPTDDCDGEGDDLNAGEGGEEESSEDDDDIPFYQMAFHSDGTIHHEGALPSMETVMIASMLSDWLGQRAALKVAAGGPAAGNPGAATAKESNQKEETSKGEGGAKKSKAKKSKKGKNRTNKGKFTSGKKK